MPNLTGVIPGWAPVDKATVLDGEASWVPDDWKAIGTEMAAAPLWDPDTAVIVGRPGGPAMRDSEVARLASPGRADLGRHRPVPARRSWRTDLRPGRLGQFRVPGPGSKAATEPMTVIAGGRTPAAAVAAAISASGARTVRWPGSVPSATVAAGVCGSIPPAMSSAAIAARLADPHHDHQRGSGPGQGA